MKKVFYLLLIPIIFAGCAANRNISTRPNFVAENYYLFGSEALQQRDFESAIQLFQKAVESDSNSVYLKETLLDVLTYTSFFDVSVSSRIIEVGKNYCENDLKSEKIYSLMAEAYNNDQQYDLAERYFKKAIKMQASMRNLAAYYVFQQDTKPKGNIKLLKKALKYPWDEKLLVLTIADYYSKIDSVKSLEIYTKIYNKWNDEDSLTPLLTAYEKLGLYDKVLEMIQFHIDNERELSSPIKTYLIGKYFALEMFDDVLKNSSICFEVGTHDVLKYLFFSAIRRNEFDIGVEAGLAIEESGELEEEFTPSFYTYFADIYLSVNNYEQAVKCILKADNIEVIYSYIISYELHESFERREKISLLLTEYLNSLEDKTKGNYLLGMFHTELNETNLAIEFLDKVSDDFINENNLNLQMAMAYLQNSADIKKAKELLVKIRGEGLSLNELIANLLLGTRHDSIAYNMYKEEIFTRPFPHISTFTTAITLCNLYDTTENLFIIFKKGIAVYPENTKLLNEAGYLIAIHEREDEYEKAEKYLKKAVSLQPENENIWDSLAWLHYKQKRYEEALEAMRVPLSKDIIISEIAYHIGEIFRSLNKNTKAKKYFKLAVELNTNKPSVQLSKEILSKY